VRRFNPHPSRCWELNLQPWLTTHYSIVCDFLELHNLESCLDFYLTIAQHDPRYGEKLAEAKRKPSTLGLPLEMTPPWSVVDNQPHQLGIRIIILCCLPLLQNTMLIMIIGLQYARPSRISMKRPRSSMDRNAIKYSSNAISYIKPTKDSRYHTCWQI
jgi:hypothetical protein